MRLSRTKLAGFIILLVMLVLFIAFVFLLTDEYEPVFWSGFVFIIIAWICLAASVLTIPECTRTGTSAAFLAIPQVLYSLLYFLIQLVAGSIIMNSSMRIKASVALQLFLLAIYAIVIMANVIYKGRSQKVQATTKAEVAFKQDLLMHLQDMIERCNQDTLRAQLHALFEEAQYSDPVSSNETLEYELRILDQMKELKAFICGGTITIGTIQLCEEARHLLKQRNVACAARKEQ